MSIKITTSTGSWESSGWKPIIANGVEIKDVKVANNNLPKYKRAYQLQVHDACNSSPSDTIYFGNCNIADDISSNGTVSYTTGQNKTMTTHVQYDSNLDIYANSSNIHILSLNMGGGEDSTDSQFNG